MNQTDVRTFKAASMQQALEIVRREMGPDAVILHTREIPPPRFLKWRKSSERVEVTAGTGVNVRTPRALQKPPAPRPAETGAPPTAPRSAYRAHEEPLAPPPPLLPATAAAPRARFAASVTGPNPGPTANPSYRTVPASPLAANGLATEPLRQVSATSGQTEQQTVIARQLSSIQE